MIKLNVCVPKYGNESLFRIDPIADRYDGVEVVHFDRPVYQSDPS